MSSLSEIKVERFAQEEAMKSLLGFLVLMTATLFLLPRGPRHHRPVTIGN
jgi:hypothetical protein